MVERRVLPWSLEPCSEVLSVPLPMLSPHVALTLEVGLAGSRKPPGLSKAH